MRRAAAIMLFAMTVASLALPLQSSGYPGSAEGAPVTDTATDATPSLSSVGFAQPLDTSVGLPEYPLVSRALMLDGGSTDALLEDLDGDGVKDLAVAVSESNQLSVFFGQTDGTFPSWPSLNVTLDAPPIEVEPVDRYDDGSVEVIVVMSKNESMGSDHFTIVNITLARTYSVESPRTLNDGASNAVVGDFLGDDHLDVAIVSAGSDPESEDGIIQVYRGPSFTNLYPMYAGHGACSIAVGDFDSDGDSDIAVSNRYDSTIEVFLSPYVPPVMSPNWTLATDGSPRWIAAGNLNSDAYMDAVAACEGGSAASSLQFFLQGSSALPVTPSLTVEAQAPPSRLIAGDFSSDNRTDVLVLSESQCRVQGYVQGTSPIWSEDPAFHFPSGAVPRGAVIGDLTGDGVTDIAVASSRYDWSGSSIAVYPGGPAFSNSNLTVWADDYANATLMATGDLDGDGSQDLVLVYPEQNAFGYMLSCSGDTNIVGIGFAAEDLLVADVNGDGMADVVTANTTHGYARVHFGNETLPSGSWRPIELECHGNVTDIAIGDLDGDGLVDVAAATAEGTIEIFFNTGSDPAFSYPLAWNATMAGPILSLAVGDFDSDGLDDLAYTRPERHIEVMIQKTSGNPISPPVDFTLAATEGPLGQIWAGEVTGDYLVDIIAMKASGDKVFVFDQTSFEDMVESDTIILPESPVYVSVMDVTDDERADMAVIYPSADLLFLYGQSGQSLPDVPSMVFVSGAVPACSGFGDVSGDGVPDLLTLDSRSGSVSAWRPVILDVGPTAMFALTDESPDEGAPFSFVDQSVGYDPIVEWSWTLTRPDMTNETWDLDGESMAQVVFVEGDGDYIMRLDVFEPDGDTDSHVVGFTVAEVPPDVTMTLSPSGGRYMEFEPITFQALAETFDPVTLYEWQFDASEAGFDPDVETEEGSVVHYYTSVGLYTAKVRVTDSNGSATVESVQLEVLDEELSGTFDDIVVTRDPDATYIITFDASALALAHPEITGVTWEFGDGGATTLTGLPTEPVTHTYSPVRDYIVNVSLSDDDGNTLRMSRTLSMIAPTVTLIGPDDGSVVASGTPIRLTVADDNPPVVSVQYSVNGGPFLDFESLYSISTDGWTDGLYQVEVMVEDADGNIVREVVVSVTIDDTDPSVHIFWDVTMLYGGDRVNISARVVDVSGLIESVILEVYFPGDDSGSQILMRPAGGNVYYAHVEIPKREGTLQFCVYAEDAAGNTASSGTYSVQIELNFVDASWPYMLAFAILAALVVAFYFLREARIAVDETFVIYSDGRLLAHSTRRLKPGMDDQVLSGMFVAVQDFVKDSFKDETSFRLRKLDFGDKSVLVEKGQHLFLAVVLHGKASKKVARRMKAVLDDIEEAFAEYLADWDGDLDKVRGVNDRVKRLYSKAPALPRPSKGKGA